MPWLCPLPRLRARHAGLRTVVSRSATISTTDVHQAENWPRWSAPGSSTPWTASPGPIGPCRPPAGHAPGNGWGRRVVSASLAVPAGFR
ncbi:hypothetical protein ACFOLD_11510 [Kocuria carniphila]|uniref:hypothetical protein n=1 Tax=Kocuria carniphila TaxID=262208 RepID=UPI00360FC52F